MYSDKLSIKICTSNIYSTYRHDSLFHNEDKKVSNLS